MSEFLMLLIIGATSFATVLAAMAVNEGYVNK